MSHKRIISIVLGIMCFALTLGICVQIKTVQGTNSTVSQNYEENNLRAEVLKYKERYENKYRDLEKAEEELEKERENSTKDNEDLENKEKIEEILTNKTNIVEMDEWLGGIDGERQEK